MPSLEFFAPGTPAPQGSKVYAVSKAGKPYGREANKGLAAWRKSVQQSAEAALLATDEWEAGYDGPVGLSILFYFPPVSSGRFWKTSAPDTDKLVRAVGDALQKAGVYKDDARVVGLEAYKTHGVITGATIRVRTIQPQPNERQLAA